MQEDVLECYPLKAVKIVYMDTETLLHFSEAILYVDTADIEYSWFVDMSDVAETGLLERLSQALDIRVMLYARTQSELEIAGEGFLHPNLSAQHAALKGEGELIGYEQIKETLQL